MNDFFSQMEFSRCDPPCRKHDMDPDFMARLNVARFLSGVPYPLTSAFRTVEYEHSKGRSGSSSHTKGVAVDIAAPRSRTRALILKGLIAAGFSRIGIGEDFIHVDADPDKDQNVIWHYYNKG